MGLSRVEKWERRLKAVLDEIDHDLEEEYAGSFPLHPNRPAHKTTSNQEDDGLFDIGASFTVGVGSQFGPGYALSVRVATLKNVPQTLQDKLEEQVVELLREKLPYAFPDTHLQVERDGPIYKIFGDLSLGTL